MRRRCTPAAAEIFAVWEEIIISKGGDKVNLAKKLLSARGATRWTSPKRHARDQQCCLDAFFTATKMKLYIPMRMCYVYAVVPQQCFIRKNQKLWNNSVAFVYWRVVSTQNNAYTHAGCVVFCSLDVVKVKLHQQRTVIDLLRGYHDHPACAHASMFVVELMCVVDAAPPSPHGASKKQRSIQRVSTQTQHYYFTVSVFFQWNMVAAPLHIHNTCAWESITSFLLR